MENLKNRVSLYKYFFLPKSLLSFLTKNINTFFILSIGRSGTKFLSDLLNVDAKTLCVHEPVTRDLYEFKKAFQDEDRAKKYIKIYRSKDIHLRMYQHKNSISSYGEVNSVLRRHAGALKNEFPEAAFFHLVRDGRKVIRSMLSRNTFSEKNANINPIVPSDPRKRKNWTDYTDFQKACWYWQEANQYLVKNISKSLRFEDILSSYDHLLENLLSPLNVNIPRDEWINMVNNPVNETKKYSFPEWKDWRPSQREFFKKTCGDLMKKLGYDLD